VPIATFWTVCMSVPTTACSVSMVYCGRLCLRNPQRNKSGGLKFGDRGGQIPRRTTDHRRTPAKNCLFSLYDGRPTLLKPADHFVTFQQCNEFGQNIWMILHSNCFCKEHLSSNLFPRHWALKSDFDTCRKFSSSAYGFSAVHRVFCCFDS
jgi:hypothetical protein